MVKVSTDLEDKQSVYLLEDGLELWLAALHNSKQLLPQWMQMVANIPRLLGRLVINPFFYSLLIVLFSIVQAEIFFSLPPLFLTLLA